MKRREIIIRVMVPDQKGSPELVEILGRIVDRIDKGGEFGGVDSKDGFSFGCYKIEEVDEDKSE